LVFSHVDKSSICIISSNERWLPPFILAAGVWGSSSCALRGKWSALRFCRPKRGRRSQTGWDDYFWDRLHCQGFYCNSARRSSPGKSCLLWWCGRKPSAGTWVPKK